MKLCNYATEDQNNEKTIFTNGGKRRSRIDVYALGPNDTILVGPYCGYLDLPGGGIDTGESVVVAGLRELAEEAGWKASNPFAITPPGNWIFSGSDDGWFDRDGWKEEENFAMACTADMFSPTESFGAHNDSLDFQLVPIRILIEDINKSLNGKLGERVELRLRFRLAVLNELNLKNNVSLESPEWHGWTSLESISVKRHNVYVVELTKDVLHIKKFMDRNPNYKHGSSCYYVGMTGLDPVERFKKHKLGIKSNVYVQRYGVRLVPGLYEKYNPMTFDESCDMEITLTAELRNRGCAVWSA